MIYYSVAAVLKFLIILKQGTLYFHFELGSANYAASPALKKGQGGPSSGPGTLGLVEKHLKCASCLCTTLRGQSETQSGSGLLTGRKEVEGS